MERLDLVELFAGADKFDGLAGHGLDGKRRAASCVAVELGEHDAGDVQILVEGLCRADGVLTGHCVDHEQNFVRVDRGLDGLELVHERLVNVQTACGVEEDHVVAVPHGVSDGCLCDIDRVCLAHFENGNAELSADDLQLLDGGGAVNVAGREQRIFVLLFEQAREFCAVGRFARALQADQHHDGRRLGSDLDLLVLAAHERGQLFVDDLDDHLRGREAFEHVRADAALGRLFDEVLDDLVVDVGLEQRQTDLAHGFLDVGLRQAALAAQLFERVRELFG